MTLHLICAGEDRLRESGLPYCIVRPGRFVDKPAGSEAKLKAGKPVSHRHSGRAMVPAVAKRGQRKLLHTRRCVTPPGMKTDAPAANVDACCPSHACCGAHSAGRHSRPRWTVKLPRCLERAGQGDTINGSISPVDVAAICVAALRDPNAAGVTFEVVDEWAKVTVAGGIVRVYTVSHGLPFWHGPHIVLPPMISCCE